MQSPQIQQLSGIGPSSLLQQHGIAVQADLPGVGENLQDHYQARVIVKLRKKMSLNDQARSVPGLLSMGARWLFSQRSEEHTSELQSLMRIAYAVFCLKKKTTQKEDTHHHQQTATTENY